MTSLKDLHLDEDHLLKAVVAEADLPRSRREHLTLCHECRKRKEAIEKNLARLGQRAEQFCPSPKRKISLAVEKPRRLWPRQWRTAIGAAVAALFIGVVGIPALFQETPRPDKPTLAQEMLEAEEFTIEINMLAENALPREYLEIVGDIDDQADEELDEGFLEFMAPTIDDKSWSYDSGRQGGKRC